MHLEQPSWGDGHMSGPRKPSPKLQDKLVRSIASLGGGIWRVRAYGATLGPEQPRQSSQLRFTVAFEHQASLMVKCVICPISFLPWIRVSDPWCDGKLVEADEIDRKLETISIPPFQKHYTVTLEDLGTVPKSFPTSIVREAALSKLGKQDFRAFRMGNGPDIVLVHPLELTRFYWGLRGAKFLRSIFRPGLDVAEFVNISECIRPNTDDGQGTISLKKSQTMRSAVLWARALWTDAGSSGLRKLSDSLRYPSREKILPSAHVPIAGATTWKCLGRWIEGPKDSGTVRIFLVDQILQCAHPFPFGSLRIKHDQPRVATGPSQPTSDGPPPPGGPPIDDDPEETIEVGDPLEDLPTVTFQDRQAIDPFPDLEHKRRVRIGPKRVREGRRSHDEGGSRDPPRDVGIGDGQPGSRLGAGDVDLGNSDAQQTLRSERLSIFRDALHSLALRQVIAELRAWPGGDDITASSIWSTRFKRITNMPQFTWGRIHPDELHSAAMSGGEGAKGQAFARRLAIATCRFQEHSVYLLDAERRAPKLEDGMLTERDPCSILLAFHPSGQPLAKEGVQALMRLAVVTRGIWTTENEHSLRIAGVPRALMRKGIRHPSCKHIATVAEREALVADTALAIHRNLVRHLQNLPTGEPLGRS